MLLNLPSPTHSRYTNLLSDIEKGEIKIPRFQRDFVWSIQQSARLLDSIIKGYPIGTFIFWRTKERLRSVRDLGGIKLPEPKDGEIVAFILDGQQRLTSLFAALKGLEVERSVGVTDDFAPIYVDLEAKGDDQIVITDVDDEKKKSCIRLTDLLNGGIKMLNSFPEKYHQLLDSYKQRIQAYDFSIIEVRDVPIEVATDIFTRINVGGRSLTLFEIMVAKTYDESLRFDLSEKFDELLEKLRTIDYETVSDATVLQLIALILKNDCKKQTILQIGRKEFISVWPKAIDGFERAIEYLRNTYRIPVSKLLPYNTLVVPFAYFFFHHPDKPDAIQKKLLEDFFWRASLGGRYSSAVESKLSQDVRRIDSILKGQNPGYDWSIDTSPDFILENGWFNAGRSFVKAILCLLAYKQPKSFIDDGHVNVRNDWLKQSNSKNYHHFFPRAYLEKQGYDDRQINNIVNITIVDDYLNKRKIGARAPSDYMKEFSHTNPSLDSSMATHLINKLDRFGIWSDDYEKFLRQRAIQISKELQKRIIVQEIDSHGQIARADDIEEEIPA